MTPNMVGELKRLEREGEVVAPQSDRTMAALERRGFVTVHYLTNDVMAAWVLTENGRIQAKAYR